MLKGQYVISPKDVNNIINKKVQFSFEFIFDFRFEKKGSLVARLSNSRLLRAPTSLQVDNEFYKITPGNFVINTELFLKNVLSRIVDISLKQETREFYKDTIDFNYLDNILNLRKISLNVILFNKDAKNLYQNFGFKVEGVLKKHTYFENDFHDVIVMALFREDFFK